MDFNGSFYYQETLVQTKKETEDVLIEIYKMADNLYQFQPTKYFQGPIMSYSAIGKDG